MNIAGNNKSGCVLAGQITANRRGRYVSGVCDRGDGIGELMLWKPRRDVFGFRSLEEAERAIGRDSPKFIYEHFL